MKALVFPGQASQFEGMGKNIYDRFPASHAYFEEADQIVGFDLAQTMFEGSAEDLKQTRVTQPSVYLYSYLCYKFAGEELDVDCTAGHSLGEITALVAAGVFSFSEGLELVKTRAFAMQKACEKQKGTMAAVIGLDDQQIVEICEGIDEIVIAANFNCPGQVVISGTEEGVQLASTQLTEAGAKRVLPLEVGGAFHSPLMQPAHDELKEKINGMNFQSPQMPIYQNVNAQSNRDPDQIKELLIRQLTSPVKWTHSMKQMTNDGVEEFIECGGKVLSGFVKRFNRRIPTQQIL